MAERTQAKRGRREPGAARAFTVVVEAMRGEFKVFGEALVDLTAKVTTGFEQVNGRFDRVEGRLDRVEGSLEQVNGRLDHVEGRLEGVEGRLEGVEGRLEGVEGRLEGVEGRFDHVEGRLEGVEGKLDRVVVDVGLVKTAVLENRRELREMRAALDRKIDRDEVESIVERVLARAQLR